MSGLLFPLIPAEAGTQFFGRNRHARPQSPLSSTARQSTHTRVPASAGMSGGI